MVKKAIFVAIVLILIINFVNAVDIHLISPQAGDVDAEDIYPQLNQFCDVDWECTSWGKCVQGVKTRACYDANSCQFKYNVPITKIKCKEQIAIEYASTLDTQLVFFGFFTGILLLILLIILLGLRR